jgi:hypothetical protein
MTKGQFRWALLVLVVSGLVGGLLGSWLLPGRAALAQEQAGAEKVVTAKRFRLVDDQGRGRAALGFDEGGDPSLRLYDAAGKDRACLAISGGVSPQLGLFDAKGKMRAFLWLLADGSPALWLCDAAGNERACLSLTADGSPRLERIDAAGKMLWPAP